MKRKTFSADVCIVLEGSYPYVAGGVSSWAHELIEMQPETSFHLLLLLSKGSERTMKYSLPDNVVGMTEVVLQSPPNGRTWKWNSNQIIRDIEPALSNLIHEGNLDDIRNFVEILTKNKGRLGKKILLDSPAAWNVMLQIYLKDFQHCSFSDFFWAWRGLLTGFYAVMSSGLPRARVYHAISTGYAGLYLARAKLELDCPTILTEHGIYTNERRIEIAMADWFHESPYQPHSMSVERNRRDIRDIWMQGFQSYSRACYTASNHVITLFEGNQNFQLKDGASKKRMEVIPNGVDYAKYEKIKSDTDKPQLSVALIGRVVPIKDIKTYIRAIARVKEDIAEVKAFVLGPCDEDPEYFRECQQLVDYLDLSDSLTFTGRVDLLEWMGKIDLNILTSISEGQPLVILEAGAAGIPTIATHVGACREMIEGDGREIPSLGSGGAVVPIANPAATARAIIRFLSNPSMLKRSGHTMQERVKKYYNKTDLQEKYRSLYGKYIYSTEGESITG